jgi:hypothetical protein
MRRHIALTALALATVGAAALANDGTAEMTAGGLVLRDNADVDMLDEDLFISMDQVRVRYVFRNQSPRDVRVLVAFPMPDRDMEEGWYSSVATVSGFRTLADGRPVPVRIEERAILNGADRTAELRRLQVPITAAADGNEIRVSEAIGRLTRAQQQQLAAAGLIEIQDNGDAQHPSRDFVPLWKSRITYYWTQTFPAGRNLVIEHSYRPGTGTSVGTSLASPEFRASAEGRQFIARYCADRTFLAAVDRMARVQRQDHAILPEQTVGYVLTTGAGWRSPIGRFRLVVDKGRPENIVSFCGEGVRRISPTRFEMVRTNWRPAQDLNIIVLQPRLREQ